MGAGRGPLMSLPRTSIPPSGKPVSSGKSGVVNILQEFSIPLIAGVVAALVFANVDAESYHAFVEYGPLDALCAERDIGGFCVEVHHDPPASEGHSEPDASHAGDEVAEPGSGQGHAAADAHVGDVGPAHPEDEHGTIKPVFGVFGHHLTLHFIINDIFMLFFFGIAAKEITESVLPGGALNPPSKAVNPLLATIGGVAGPVAVYLALSHLIYAGADAETKAAVLNGWGIPTATDIALAWLVARVVFGATHPAVNFLLLLAIADDAIGLGIIAIFYPNPYHPPAPVWLLLVGVGMLAAYLLRKRKVRSWIPYIAIGGLISWVGLLKASLHPALALVPIVPFLPGPASDTGFFNAEDEADLERSQIINAAPSTAHSTLHDFEHQMKLFVDMGLFFFGLMNAGVELASVNAVTWIVLASLVVGKTVGVSLFSYLGSRMGFQYPKGMRIKHVLVAGMVAGLGLTVALFVAGEAFPGSSPYQGPAKMGALASVVAGVLAFVAGRALNVKKLYDT